MENRKGHETNIKNNLRKFIQGLDKNVDLTQDDAKYILDCFDLLNSIKRTSK